LQTLCPYTTLFRSPAANLALPTIFCLHRSLKLRNLRLQRGGVVLLRVVALSDGISSRY
jgi:hypothetical protein